PSTLNSRSSYAATAPFFKPISREHLKSISILITMFYFGGCPAACEALMRRLFSFERDADCPDGVLARQ
ncbi:hypothetical protein, partial [Burkholderia vietnamiensis]|uniref:hypothetical protein n=1 Tax=Burkholderia vietnamiensis TaxID=60552 RepID=UPI001C6123F0